MTFPRGLRRLVLWSLLALGLAAGNEEKELEVCDVGLLQSRRAKTETDPSKELTPHPFYAAVQRACMEETCIMFARNRNFYEIMATLEAHRDTLSKNCRETAFGGTFQHPNSLIFTKIDTDTVNLGPELGISADFQYLVKRSIGYVGAPLMYSTPGHTAIYRTWFLIIEAKTQPAPKGMLFVHLGGPTAGILDGSASYAVYFKEYLDQIQEYDVVFVDQRGMGLSYAGLLNDFATPTSWEELKGEPAKKPAVLFMKVFASGLLALNINFTDSKGVVHQPPCTFLLNNNWNLPADYGNHGQVLKYLERKAEMISACSKRLDRPDGHDTYNLLQYMGTQALVHDIEWLRWAFGGYPITVLGFSYGTRVAAAYASQFPGAIQRVAVSGVEAPNPDLLEFAKEAGLNTAEILGFIQSQCAETTSCRKNPWTKGELNEEDYYFDGDIDAAVEELFRRSSHGAIWYPRKCGGNYTSLAFLSDFLREFLVSMDPQQAPLVIIEWLRKVNHELVPWFQDATWPIGFQMLPAVVFAMVQNPCTTAAYAMSRQAMSAFNGLAIIYLIPALDMTGRWQVNQVAKYIASHVADRTLMPAARMFVMNAEAAYGWPQLPTPVGFSNPTVDAVAVNTLYDERTGMNMAQKFQENFPNSSLVTSLGGGHCVNPLHGLEGYRTLMQFLFFGWKPSSGDIVDRFVKIDFAEGASFAALFPLLDAVIGQALLGGLGVTSEALRAGGRAGGARKGRQGSHNEATMSLGVVMAKMVMVMLVMMVVVVVIVS
ncbi:caeA [Symbiodinium sp. CCMP2592]|nr:caeA [Symbiodinium sp. CCMP2592]